MRLRPSELLSRLNASYWFNPLLVALAGLALALILLRLDSRGVSGPGMLAMFVPTAPEGARALLSAIVASMLTAISVTFSVTIVALTVAAQHFGPRMLNSFVRHTTAQVVLGTFIATFIYAVLVLGAIRSGGSAGAVPQLAVTGAVALVLVSIGALIFYVHHVSTSLQVGELAAEVARDMRTALRRQTTAAPVSNDEPPEEIPEAPADAAAVAADETGYMQRVDFEEVARLAQSRDVRIWLRREPGAFVLAGCPLALVAPGRRCDEAIARALREACVVGRDRTLWSDPEFAVKQLVEIALRALSPGVNEPFTAITCIDRLGEGLSCALGEPRPRAVWRDADGTPRVYSTPQPFPTLLRAAFDPIRLFAGTNPAVYARLTETIGELALLAGREEDRAALTLQLELIHSAAAALDARGRDFVERRLELAFKQLEGRPAGTRRPAAGQ